MDFLSSLLSFLGPLGGVASGAIDGDIGGGLMKSMDPLGSMLGFSPLSMMMGGQGQGQSGAGMQGSLLKHVLSMPDPMILGGATNTGPTRTSLGGY